MEQFMMMMMLHLVTNVTFGYNSIDEVRKDDEMGIYDSGMKMQTVCLKVSKYAVDLPPAHSSICPTSPPIAYMCSACRNPI